MEKMYCYYCNNDVDTIEKIEKKIYTVHKEKIMMKEKTYRCKQCHKELINDSLESDLTNIYNKYLEIYHLSIPKLKEIRKSLNLSQELFAEALGWSKKTINRYENGQSLPQKEYLKIYQKIQNNNDEFLHIVEQNKEKLKNHYYMIVKKISTNIGLKTIHTFLYILNKSSLYETQIMKYLFAIDFESAKKIGTPITELKYAHAPYGPIIDQKTILLNYLIKNNYLQLTEVEDDKVKFIATKKFDEKLFSQEEIEIMKKIKEELTGKTSTELSKWSHTFKGWKETNDGEIISFQKYAKYFEI